MTYPQVIVATRCVPAPAGALVIDYGSGQFWRDGLRLGGGRSRYGRAMLDGRRKARLIRHGHRVASAALYA